MWMYSFVNCCYYHNIDYVDLKFDYDRSNFKVKDFQIIDNIQIYTYICNYGNYIQLENWLERLKVNNEILQNILNKYSYEFQKFQKTINELLNKYSLQVDVYRLLHSNIIDVPIEIQNY